MVEIFDKIISSYHSAQSKRHFLQLTGKDEYIVSEMDESYIVCGSGKLTIKGKCNHILLLDVKDSFIEIENIPVTGMDLLRCNRLKIVHPGEGWIGCEFSENINIHSINHKIYLFSHHSLDLSLNGFSFMVNPFTTYFFDLSKY